MKTVKTISVTLKPKYVEMFDRVVSKTKSKTRSAALRVLLDFYENLKEKARWEKMYDEYYKDVE